MLHFVHLHAWDIEASPFGAELRRLGVAHRFLVMPISLRYRSRAELALRIYPQLAWRALKCAIRSLVFSRPPPDAVVISSDVEALIFGAVRSLVCRRTLVVFQTLIVSRRRSRLANALYIAYWRLVMATIDLGICHARAEIAANKRLFARDADKLEFIPLGTTITNRAALLATPPLGDGTPVVVTAGRSGRDYRTLACAIAGLPCRLMIICDIAAPLAGVPSSQQIEIVRDCFDESYVRALAGAAFVVVPLAVDDISAGQLVLLQAAALGRAVVITRTTSTVDYASDEEDALLVGIGDVAALRHAMVRLLESAALRIRLGAAATARFDREYSTEAYVRRLVAAVQARIPPDA